jgi:hypothetical protein
MNLVVKPGRSRRYQTPAPAARTIAALRALRDQVIAPILAGLRSPRTGRKPAPGLLSTGTRDPPHRHAGPLPPLRPHRRSPGRIDNIFWMTGPQAYRAGRGQAGRPGSLAAQ